MIRNIQQDRARFALKLVQDSLKDGVNSKEFRSYANSLPSMIHQVGLGKPLRSSAAKENRPTRASTTACRNGSAQRSPGLRTKSKEIYFSSSRPAISMPIWRPRPRRSRSAPGSSASREPRSKGRHPDMPLPLYSAAAESPTPNLAHAGLFFERFFDRYDDRWSVTDKKRDWLRDMVVKGNAWLSRQREDIEDRAFERIQMVEAMGGEWQCFQCPAHFCTGLGKEHPLENGFTFHPSTGSPYLPGSTIKGLLRGWLEVWEEQASEEIQSIFGSTKNAGELIVLDAIPTAPAHFVADIMTPHMGKWYEQGHTIGDLRSEAQKVPADWHAPNPIPFLTATKVKLLFAILPRTSAAQKRVGEAMASLREALLHGGVGSKTSSGYGHFEADEDAQQKLRTRIKKIQEAKQQAEAEEQRNEARAKMPADERVFELCLEAHAQDNGSGSKAESAIRCLEAKSLGNSQDETIDQELIPQIAKRLKQWMQEQGIWREESQKKNPNKDKDYTRTMRAKKLLAES
jgi:CRISPR-associated protein Cmr6